MSEWHADGVDNNEFLVHVTAADESAFSIKKRYLLQLRVQRTHFGEQKLSSSRYQICRNAIKFLLSLLFLRVSLNCFNYAEISLLFKVSFFSICLNNDKFKLLYVFLLFSRLSCIAPIPNYYFYYTGGLSICDERKRDSLLQLLLLLLLLHGGREKIDGKLGVFSMILFAHRLKFSPNLSQPFRGDE
jgi:hypothetical protein